VFARTMYLLSGDGYVGLKDDSEMYICCFSPCLGYELSSFPKFWRQAENQLFVKNICELENLL